MPYQMRLVRNELPAITVRVESVAEVADYAIRTGLPLQVVTEEGPARGI